MTPWRNGSASDSRSEGCVFKSRRGHYLFVFFFKKLLSPEGRGEYTSQLHCQQTYNKIIYFIALLQFFLTFAKKPFNYNLNRNIPYCTVFPPLSLSPSRRAATNSNSTSCVLSVVMLLISLWATRLPGWDKLPGAYAGVTYLSQNSLDMSIFTSDEL